MLMQNEGSVIYICNMAVIFGWYEICQEHEIKFPKYLYSAPVSIIDTGEFICGTYMHRHPYIDVAYM